MGRAYVVLNVALFVEVNWADDLVHPICLGAIDVLDLFSMT